ncbi:MAG: 5-(carboxyamino)imidazole ribonucleotide synthase [Anaerolineae bacterium]|nr:5-(carboxyamino)imidazole ribonucleotide synthase [Anaerolineae bacterium]
MMYPGSTIGVLGSGQLGRMLALAARPLGYHIHIFSPERDTPAGQVADLEICAAYDDLDAVRAFARGVDVVTYEFENVPAATAVACQEFAPLRPGPQALHMAQNRLREKTFFVENGLPTAPFTAVHSLTDLQNGLVQIGCPAVLKTAVSGYDGKGQIKLMHPDEAEAAWQAVGQVDCILEGWVEFEREVSVVAARGLDGRFAHYGVIENSHANHILDVSKAPADVPPDTAKEAVAMAQCVLEALDVVGVLCVEFFLTGDGRLLLNEMAPRPHNSGHLTIEACVTSQFEQQCRAVCGLPLGDTCYRQPAAMANLLGDLWDIRRKGAKEQRGEEREGEVDWTAVLRLPHIKVHLYGKREPRPGRKMGHLTALADSVGEAERIVREARALLGY